MSSLDVETEHVVEISRDSEVERKNRTVYTNTDVTHWHGVWISEHKVFNTQYNYIQPVLSNTRVTLFAFNAMPRSSWKQRCNDEMILLRTLTDPQAHNCGRKHQLHNLASPCKLFQDNSGAVPWWRTKMKPASRQRPLLAVDISPRVYVPTLHSGVCLSFHYRCVSHTARPSPRRTCSYSEETGGCWTAVM